MTLFCGLIPPTQVEMLSCLSISRLHFREVDGLHIYTPKLWGGDKKERARATICLAKHTHLPFRRLIGSQDQVQSELESFG